MSLKLFLTGPLHQYYIHSSMIHANPNGSYPIGGIYHILKIFQKRSVKSYQLINHCFYFLKILFIKSRYYFCHLFMISELQWDKIRHRYYERVARYITNLSVVVFFPHTLEVVEGGKEICPPSNKLMGRYDVAHMNTKDQLEVQLTKETIPKVIFRKLLLIILIFIAILLFAITLKHIMVWFFFYFKKFIY